MNDEKTDPYPGTPNKINMLWCVGNSLDPELSVPAGQADLNDQKSVFIAFVSHVRLDFFYCSLVPFKLEMYSHIYRVSL